MRSIKIWTKETIKNMIRKSPRLKEIIRKLNRVVLEESNLTINQVISTDVIYPRVKEYLYNKRINNYLLDKT